MSELQTVLNDIAASLYMKPGTFDDLASRKFMKGKSNHGIITLLRILITKKACYKKDEKYYTYKKYALSDRMKEYELE